jgi:hypothetical protein
VDCVAGLVAGTSGFDFINSQSNPRGTISLLAGELLISDTLFVIGNGADATIIDAQGTPRVFNIAAAAANVTLLGLTITGGSVADASGDGIFSSSPGTLAARKSMVSFNSVVASTDLLGAASGEPPALDHIGDNRRQLVDDDVKDVIGDRQHVSACPGLSLNNSAKTYVLVEATGRQ